jgi:hypothetical protein
LGVQFMQDAAHEGDRVAAAAMFGRDADARHAGHGYGASPEELAHGQDATGGEDLATIGHDAEIGRADLVRQPIAAGFRGRAEGEGRHANDGIEVARGVEGRE